MGDCDGPGARAARRHGAAGRGSGLREFSAHCEDFAAGTDFLAWMRLMIARSPRPMSIGWGARWCRSSRRVRCNERSARACRDGRWNRAPMRSGCAHELVAFVAAEVARGACADPAGADAARLAHAPTWSYLIIVPVIALLLSPLLLVLLPFCCGSCAGSRPLTRDLPAPRHRGTAKVAAHRGPGRDQSVHGDRLAQARGVSPLAGTLVLLQLIEYSARHALHARLPGAGANHSFRALGVHR